MPPERATSQVRLPRSEPPDPALPSEVIGWHYGVRAGLLGAAVVALLLLGVDLAAGRPLWTPAVLGSALFTGERLAAAGFAPQAHAALIAGYTAVHGALYVGFGALVTFFLVTARKPPRSGVLVALLAGAFFVLFELAFLAQAALFAPRLADDLAAGWVGVANACAAVAMGFYVASAARPRSAPPA